MAEESCGKKSHQPVGNRENQSAAQMSHRPRIPRTLGPPQLVLPHLPEGFLTDDVVDDVGRKHGTVTGLRDLIADRKIVGNKIFQRGVTANARQSVLSDYRSWPKSELNSFQQICD